MKLGNIILVLLLIAFCMAGSSLSDYSQEKFESTMENFTWHDIDEIECNEDIFETNGTTVTVPCGMLPFTEKVEKSTVRFTNAVGYAFIEGGKFVMSEARESELAHGRHHNYNLMITLMKIGIYAFVLRYLLPLALFVIFLIKWIYEMVKPYIDNWRKGRGVTPWKRKLD